MVDQVSPPLKETQAPPSLPSIMRRGSAGSIHRSWLSPCGADTVVKVLPASVDFQAARLSTHTVSASCGSANTWW